MILTRVAGRIRAMMRNAYTRAQPPRYPGMRLTPTRWLNYNLIRFQHARGHTKLLGYPIVLTLEATNVCNLNCPHCFTGANEVGRERTMMPMSLYRKLLDELGNYVCFIELYNWGEPLLNKRIHEMISLATSKGISTGVSSNFSIPFDSSRAEQLVSSGLSILGVSLDGARQESYEKYRVGGNLDKVLQNIRLMNQAKTKLGSSFPRMIWEFHVFEWNKEDIETARSMASDLEMEFAVSKGWVQGEEWDRRGEFSFDGVFDLFRPGIEPERCKYLWNQGVINNDGGVGPCCGTFYKEDDYGSVANRTFKQVWNNKSFQEARRLFRSRDASGQGESLICHDCPSTILWDNYKRHRAQGLPASSFDSGYTMNDSFNYFFNRRPSRVDGTTEDASQIELMPVGGPLKKKS